MDYAIQLKPGRAVITLYGDLDEKAESQLIKLESELPDRLVEFDMARVGPVNSIGFRALVEFLKKVDGARFTLEKCGEDLLTLFNLLPQTAFASRIRSVLVPYCCPRCKHQDTRQFRTENLSPDEPFDELACARCGTLAEATVTSAEYLEFLRFVAD